MFIAAEDAATMPALQSGKATHTRHPAKAEAGHERNDLSVVIARESMPSRRRGRAIQ
jgi:hypothetical protein